MQRHISPWFKKELRIKVLTALHSALKLVKNSAINIDLTSMEKINIKKNVSLRTLQAPSEILRLEKFRKLLILGFDFEANSIQYQKWLQGREVEIFLGNNIQLISLATCEISHWGTFDKYITREATTSKDQVTLLCIKNRHAV